MSGQKGVKNLENNMATWLAQLQNASWKKKKKTWNKTGGRQVSSTEKGNVILDNT